MSSTLLPLICKFGSQTFSHRLSFWTVLYKITNLFNFVKIIFTKFLAHIFSSYYLITNRNEILIPFPLVKTSKSYLQNNNFIVLFFLSYLTLLCFIFDIVKHLFFCKQLLFNNKENQLYYKELLSIYKIILYSWLSLNAYFPGQGKWYLLTRILINRLIKNTFRIPLVLN